MLPWPNAFDFEGVVLFQLFILQVDWLITRINSILQGGIYWRHNKYMKNMLYSFKIH